MLVDLVDGSTNVCVLTPGIALLVICCSSVGRMLLSCLVPTIDVDRCIGRCFARHKTVRNCPLNGENQLEWSNADVPKSFPGTTAV